MTKRIFLTGATGNVGPHLLASLLERSAHDVTCLVRASGDDAARSRVGRALSDAGYDAEALLGRVRALAGDVTAPRLGLEAGAYDALVAEVSQVVHAAAWLGDRQTFDPKALDNVAGATAVVDLCLRAKVRLDHVSTIGVLRWTAEDDEGVFREEAFSEHPEPPVRGGPYAYYFSKWMAEQLVLYASASIPVTVHRLSDVFSPAADPGMSALAGAVAALKRLPDDDALSWSQHSIADVTAGQTLAALALQPHEGLRVVHDVAYVDGVSVADVAKAFAARGVTLARVPKEAWMAALRSEVPWIGALAEWQVAYLLEPCATIPRYGNEVFREHVAKAGIVLPTAEERFRPFCESVTG